LTDDKDDLGVSPSGFTICFISPSIGIFRLGGHNPTVNPRAEGFIQFTVLNSATNKPVRNVIAEAATLASNGFSTPCSLLRLITQILTTGANGTVSFCCDTGFYNVTVGYSGLTYLIQTVIKPERCTRLILFVPTGKTAMISSQEIGSCPCTD
jgi:hypothetical protein